MFNFFQSLFKEISNQINAYRNINILRKKEIRFIFYSEGEHYQKYAYLLIKTLSEKFPNKIYYVSSSIEDSIKDLQLNNFYIGKGFLLQYFFLTIKAENLFLTLTDLNNNILKKTKNIKKYIYYFHSPVSTTKVYTSGAFDHYDTILCIGDYQIQEIQHREKIKKLPPKKLIKNGYFYFDYLNKKINIKKAAESVLIAPSWNYNEKYFINQNFLSIINILLKKNYNVIFRPHPEHLKRSMHILKKIKINIDNSKFKYDLNSENLESMEDAKCLITDNSGIAIEYSLLFKRPVLYLVDKEKQHNSDLTDYADLLNFEEDIKDKFGFKFNKRDFETIDLLIDKSVIDFKNRHFEIEDYLNEKIYNYNNTVNFLMNDNNEIFN